MSTKRRPPGPLCQKRRRTDRGSMKMKIAGRLLLAFVIALASPGAMSQQSSSNTEIRIGNLMPYTGPLAEFAAIGKAEAAYFDMINDRGGINGRKLRFISYDDNYGCARSDPRAGREGQRPVDVRVLRNGRENGGAELSKREEDSPTLRCLGRRGVGRP